ncbi:MAG TPA: alcohol dehydrogenase catalytic domain-containing protein, partial [Pseudonocardia sp.]|nr:alcohol dehydrogenase catalytic domain-containing protein [Pseudonocardia sp.]
MRAVSCHDGALEVVDLPSPEPARGQLLLTVLRCGICGSDLHARQHSDELADVTSEMGYDGIFRASDTVVLGHEFCGEVLDARAGAAFRTGTRVVSFPLL